MNTITYIGIDVSKAHLDMAGAPGSRRISNTAAAVAAWIKTLLPGSHLVLEATGGYERTLVNAAHAAGLAVSVLNPRRVRAFARASGRLAKTDAIDAASLLAFAQALHPPAQAAPNPQLRALAELVNARDKLVALRLQFTNALEHAQHPLVRQSFTSQARLITTRLRKIEAAISAALQAGSELQARSRALQNHYGVGPQITATLLAHLPQLGHANRQQIASLAGLAPFNRDSGQTRGPRFTSGGRPRVRRALYLAALTAIRADSPLRAFYLHLRHNGKPPKLALIASARKLLAFLNSSLKKLHA